LSSCVGVKGKLEPEIRVVIEINGKRNKREIQGKNFHDIRKDRAGR
jgi:hypothetical protein